MILYRIVDDVESLKQVVALEIAVWGLEAVDAVPTSIMRALAHTGGLIVGAYDGQQLVGMALAFPSIYKNELVMWSHMAGVDKPYQSRGIGYELKRFQADWARERGYKHIGWTFDPLQRGNASFNLAQLGAHAVEYKVNFYGDMTDDINKGMPSDRIVALWDITNTHQVDKALPQFDSTIAALTINQHNDPLLKSDIISDTEFQFIQIPSSLSRLSSDQMLKWRFALREAFSKLLSLGYIASNFMDVLDTGVYIFQKQNKD